MKDQFFGFCLGAGIGLGIACLLAPKSGAQTRSLVRHKVLDGTEYLSQRSGELKDAVVHRTEAVQAALQAGTRAYARAVEAV